MNRDGGAYNLPVAYDRLLVTCSTSRDHKPDEARERNVATRLVLGRPMGYLSYFKVEFKNVITRSAIFSIKRLIRDIILTIKYLLGTH